MIIRGFRSSRALWAKKDYYKILGVPRTASEAEIKKAYFSLAKKHHPDIDKSPEAQSRFTEISDAYETLGDTEKRRNYDETGMNSDEQNQARSSGFGDFGGGFGGFNPFQGDEGEFEDFFSQFSDIFGMGTKREKKNYKGEDIHLNMEVPFMDAVKGGIKQINFERKSVCETCEGKKTKPGTSPSRCMSCGGKGFTYFEKGPMTIETSCEKCKGTGYIIKNYCPTCKGVGFSNSEVKETINIPVGINTGHSLRVANKGHTSETGGPSGDLNIKIRIGTHPLFKRDGYDIISEVAMSVSEAVLGGSIEVDLLEGKQTIELPAGSSNGHKITLKNKGITHLHPNSRQKGNHIIQFSLKIPKNLSENQKKLFKELAVEEGLEVAEEKSFFNRFKFF